MQSVPKQLLPDRQGFAADPFGYSSLAWHRWGLLRDLAGYPVDLEQPPTDLDLKSPVLWLSQARALSEAATAVLRNEPSYGSHPKAMSGVCDSQYCAVGLMLVGYSLEIALKAMLILRHGVEAYAENERRHKHHRLDDLASFVPDLSEKDRAILRLLSQFVSWAGRYPDPGSGRAGQVESIFAVSERYRLAASDLMSLVNRVMGHVSIEVESAT